MLFVLLGQSFDMCDVSPQNEHDTFANIVFWRGGESGREGGRTGREMGRGGEK